MVESGSNEAIVMHSVICADNAPLERSKNSILVGLSILSGFHILSIIVI